MVKDHDVSKLPKWARQEIERLTRDVEHLSAKLSAGPENSNTFADPYSDSKRPLGLDTAVEFVLDQKRWDGRGSRIRVALQDGVLNVNGDDQLLVMPRAANTLLIGFRER